MWFNNTRNQETDRRSDRSVLKYWMGMKILTEILNSRLRKGEGLEDMELHWQRSSVD